MAKHKIDIMSLAVDSLFPLDLSKNVRDPSGATYDVGGLKADIFATGGLTARPLVHFKGGKFDRVIRGYRRVTAVGQLKAEYPHDRRWDKIEAEVQHDLTEAEIIDLMIDHGNTKSLEKHEVVRAIWMELDADPTVTDARLAAKVQGLLEVHFPWPVGKDKTEAAVADHYHGTIQNIRNGFRLPKVAQDAYLRKVRGEISYPTKKEVATLVKIFEDARKADPKCEVTKENPGATFTKKWEELVASYEAAGAEPRQKAVSMMSRTEVSAIGDNTPSLLLRGIIKTVTRDVPESDAKLVFLGKWMAGNLESKLSDQDKKDFVAIMEGRLGDVKLPEAAASKAA